MNIRHLLIVLTMTTTLLTGCFWQDVEYPSDWLEIAQEWRIGCPDLTGTYRFNGDYSTTGGGGTRGTNTAPMSIFFRINQIQMDLGTGGKPYSFEKITHAKVVGPKNGEIHASMWEGKKLIKTSVLSSSAGDFSCTLGSISTKIGSSEYSIYRSRDGALVNKSAGFTCVPAFIPVCMREASWRRWPLLKAAQ